MESVSNIKIGMRFIDSNFLLHIITSVTTACGGGFTHIYEDGGKLVDGWMYQKTFDKLLKIGNILLVSE